MRRILGVLQAIADAQDLPGHPDKAICQRPLRREVALDTKETDGLELRLRAAVGHIVVLVGVVFEVVQQSARSLARGQHLVPVLDVRSERCDHLELRFDVRHQLPGMSCDSAINLA